MPTIKYRVIKQGCMTILAPFRFSPAALWPVFPAKWVQNDGIHGQNKHTPFCLQNWSKIIIFLAKLVQNDGIQDPLRKTSTFITDTHRS